MSGIMEWAGCILGLLGAVLLAVNCRVSRWGWVAYLLSNAAWIGYSIHAGANGLLLQQVFLIITNIVGLRRWFFATQKTERIH
jgi:hypothetical protein